MGPHLSVTAATASIIGGNDVVDPVRGAGSGRCRERSHESSDAKRWFVARSQLHNPKIVTNDVVAQSLGAVLAVWRRISISIDR